MNYKKILFGILFGILIIMYINRKKIKSFLFSDKNNKVIKNEENLQENLQENLEEKLEEKLEDHVILEIVASPKENVEINLGKITIKLFEKIVPRTCENFKSLAKIEYKNCAIHRIIPGFMFQSGDYENHDGTGGNSSFGGKFVDENFELKHNKKGIVSMANSGANTNGSQFFITFNETSWLDNKHVVFGEVIDGIDVLDKIESIPVNNEIPQYLIYIKDCQIVKM